MRDHAFQGTRGMRFAVSDNNPFPEIRSGQDDVTRQRIMNSEGSWIGGRQKSIHSVGIAEIDIRPEPVRVKSGLADFSEGFGHDRVDPEIFVAVQAYVFINRVMAEEQ